MKQQNALNQIQSAQNQEVILPITTTRQQTIESLDKPGRHVPLETFLQLEELAKSRVARQLRELFLGRRPFGSALIVDFGCR